jgi:hypothetical protein
MVYLYEVPSVIKGTHRPALAGAVAAQRLGSTI